MPSAQYGFSGNEIVSRVQSYVGNYSNAFQTYIQQTLPLAESRFCKAHDWKFLHKTRLPLTISNGTAEYTLDSTTIGFYMSADDVSLIFDETNGRVIKRVDLQEIRRLDPDNNDGSATDEVQLWAPVGDNRILLWPKTFESGTLRLDGKIRPTPLLTLTNYPTVPYHYQESLIEYIIALALDRENDDRAPIKRQEAQANIRVDILDDMGMKAEVETSRIRHMNEASQDGVGPNLDMAIARLFWGE